MLGGKECMGYVSSGVSECIGGRVNTWERGSECLEGRSAWDM